MSLNKKKEGIAKDSIEVIHNFIKSENHEIEV